MKRTVQIVYRTKTETISAIDSQTDVDAMYKVLQRKNLSGILYNFDLIEDNGVWRSYSVRMKFSNYSPFGLRVKDSA